MLQCPQRICCQAHKYEHSPKPAASIPANPCCHCAAGPADARRSSLLSAIVNSTGPRSSRSAPPGPADPLAGYGVRPHKVGTAQLQDAAGKIYPNQLADSPKAGKPVQGSSFFTASGSGVMR